MNYASRACAWFIVMTMVLSLPACALRALILPWHYRGEPIEAWVADAETKEPLEGVIVTANWQLESGLEGAIVTDPQAMVMETVTDERGRFSFPAWGPVQRKQGRLGSSSPQLLFFKPGYEPSMLRNRFREGMELDVVQRSDWNGKTIELRPSSVDVERHHKSLTFLNDSLEFLMWADSCDWEKIPRMIVAADAELKRIEAELMQMKSNFNRHLPRSSMLDTLLNNDENLKKRGCKSPKQAFGRSIK